MLGVVGSAARRIGIGSGRLLEAVGVASITAGPFLFAGLVIQQAGPVERWGWVVAMLVVPAALTGWTFTGHRTIGPHRPPPPDSLGAEGLH